MDSRLLRTLRSGFKSLLLHKLRSGLATLGILIGVTAVIWLVALGEGVSYQAQQQIKDLGATNIIVRSVKPPMQSSKPGTGKLRRRLRPDARRLRPHRFHHPHRQAGRSPPRNPQGGPLPDPRDRRPLHRLHPRLCRHQPSRHEPRPVPHRPRPEPRRQRVHHCRRDRAATFPLRRSDRQIAPGGRHVLRHHRADGQPDTLRVDRRLARRARL